MVNTTLPDHADRLSAKALLGEPEPTIEPPRSQQAAPMAGPYAHPAFLPLADERSIRHFVDIFQFNLRSAGYISAEERPVPFKVGGRDPRFFGNFDVTEVYGSHTWQKCGAGFK